MGGKNRLAPQILKHMSDHKVYVEPFFGSGALFFRKGYKEVSDNHNYREVIGDLDFNVVNFFEQLRENKESMFEKLRYYEYSETLNKKSKTNSDYYKNADNITKACLFLFNTITSFGGRVNEGFAYSRTGVNHVKKLESKINSLDAYVKRLKEAYIFHKSYDVLIDRFDTKETLFYFDPPYKETTKYNTNEINYDEFADKIKQIKGKWILSHYKDEWLTETFKDYRIIDLNHSCSIQKSNGEKRKGQNVNECIVLNYNPEDVYIWTGKEEKYLFGGVE